MEELQFLTAEQTWEYATQHPTPFFVYSEERILGQIAQLKAMTLPQHVHLNLRYAMKACATSAILKIMLANGIDIDASSEYEVFRALKAGYEPHQIELTAQETPRSLRVLVEKGIIYNACSLKQLRAYGETVQQIRQTQPEFHPKFSIRVNPAIGSGEMTKMNVGGVQSAFGIWHEKLDQVDAVCKEFNLTLVKIHAHIGSGTDPAVWKEAAKIVLNITTRFPAVRTVNLGGGFKVARILTEKSTNPSLVSEAMSEILVQFPHITGLELEPGSFYMVNAGSLITHVDDVIDTWSSDAEPGYVFVKLNTGMDAITRPSLYGSKHALVTVPPPGETRVKQTCVVVGHCCESGDLLTQELGGTVRQIELLQPKTGDVLVIEGVGAYCSAMNCKNYNSFPELAEFLLQKDGSLKLIRRAQTLDQILQNEVC